MDASFLVSLGSLIVSAVAIVMAVQARRAAGRAALDPDLRPLLVEAREYFGDLKSYATPLPRDIKPMGELSRRLDEHVPADRKLREAVSEVRSALQGAWSKRPTPTRDSFGEETWVQEDIPKLGAVVEQARKGEAAAHAALIRLSKLRGRAG